MERPECPRCGKIISYDQQKDGLRVARCQSCSQLMRLVEETPHPWQTSRPTGESAPTPFEWGNPGVTAHMPAAAPILRTEALQTFPYPNIYCPYCECLNRDFTGSEQSCTNCGGNLKKPCYICSYPVYLLDRFCPGCNSDQERAFYELEAQYVQRYKYGLKMAQNRQWREAQDALAIFFDPPAPHDTAEAQNIRVAQSVYLNNLAPLEGEKKIGLNSYWQAREELVNRKANAERKLRRKRLAKVAGIILGLVVTGAVTLYAILTWGALLLLLPVGVILLLILIYVMAASMGFGIG